MHLKSFLFPFLLLCCLSTNALSQGAMLDSLRRSLANHQSQDSVRVRLLINLSNTVVWNDTKEALALAHEALELTKRIAWIRGEAFAYRQIGLVYYRMADFIKAMEMSQEALRVNEQMGDKNFEVGVYNNLGNIHSDMKEYDKAQAAYGRLLSLSKELGQKNGEVIGLVNRGLVLREQGKYVLAIKDLKQALNVAQS